MTSWKDLNDQYVKDISNDSEDVVSDYKQEINSQGDNSKVSRKMVNYYEIVGSAVNISRIIVDTLISHPWIVLRRQCHIRHDCLKFHWTPFSVVPVVCRILTSQGLQALWKGTSSSICICLLNLASDSIMSELFSLPKEISKHSSFKKCGQHILLKSITWTLLTPFYAANLIETVQTDLTSDPTTIFSFFVEGFRRMVIFQREPVSRLLPIWKIIPIVVTYGVCHYLIKTLAEFASSNYMNSNQIDLVSQNPQEVQLDDIYFKYYTELFSSIVGSCVADVILYPFEVITNRLCIQGTRVLIDNMDNPYEMVPVCTSYYGFSDALNTILNETAEHSEGTGGLYKGFGAVILQYGIQFLLLYSIKLGYEYLLIHTNTNHNANPSNKETDGSSFYDHQYEVGSSAQNKSKRKK